MPAGAASFVKSFDQVFSRGYLKLFRERNSLICLLFHGLLSREDDVRLNQADPQQRMTVGHFRRIVDYFLDKGYEIVSPVDVLEGLDSDKKYVLITFDDGYYGSVLALPVLNEFKVPATFFISTNFVKHNKCFWWDVLWRERIKSGMAGDAIHRETEQLKSRTNSGIEKLLMTEFGEDSFRPLGDLDRPMTVSELKEFSRESMVFLGNHTLDHAILTNYSADAAASQINDSQKAIFEMTGEKPVAIAYPSGNYSDDIIRIAKDAGLRLGITIEPRKNYLPLDLAGNEGMRLGRFALMGDRKLEPQLAYSRSDVTLRRLVRRIRHR